MISSQRSVSASTFATASRLFAILAIGILLTGCDSEPNSSTDSQDAPAVAANRDSEDTTDPDTASQEPMDQSTSDQESANDGEASDDEQQSTEQTPAVPPKDPDDPRNPLAIDSPLAGIEPPTEEPDEPEFEQYPEVHTIDIPGTWTRAFKDHEVWVDVANKSVIAGGVICMDRGPLEMFICPLYTKEHESVAAVNAKSRQIHRTLLALGCNPGSPVQWEPEYKPATGPKVTIELMWKDEESGEIMRRNGREMILNSRRGKELDVDFVFGGSQIYQDPEDGTVYYYGDAGELVCLSNFSTATMDVPIKSPKDNLDLMYEANTDKIPEPGTKVYVIFSPEFPDEGTQPEPGAKTQRLDPDGSATAVEPATSEPPATETGSGGDK